MTKNLSKKVLLAVFALSTILFQTSCSKSDEITEEIIPPVKEETTTQTVIYRITSPSDINTLWTMNADGTNKKQISISLPSGFVLTYEDLAEVSSDGKTLVFLVQNETTFDYSIYKCNIDGTNATRILGPSTLSLGLQAVVNNTSVLYTKGDGNWELWSVNIDGTNDHKIDITLPTGIALEEEELAKVTDDGKTIVFIGTNTSTNANTIYKCNLDGSGVSVVTTETATYELRLQSLTKNNTVLFGKEGSLANELWSVNLDGSSKQKLSITLPTGIELQSEEMARSKGDVLFFSIYNTVTNKEAIYTAKADGSNVKLLTEENANFNIAIQTVY